MMVEKVRRGIFTSRVGIFRWLYGIRLKKHCGVQKCHNGITVRISV